MLSYNKDNDSNKLDSLHDLHDLHGLHGLPIKLEVKNVSKTFESMKVLDDLSIKLFSGEFVSILGPSGSGKSTLFNIISGLSEPDSGSVLIDAEDYTKRTGRVSYMHQKDLLLPWKKIIDNVALPLVIKGEKKKEARNKVKDYFKTFGLLGFEEKYPSQLSGGMKQRASLLRAYMFAKDILLLDEPFGGLDAITKSKMQNWLLSVFNNLNSSILFITHDIDEAIILSDRIYVLSERPAKVKAEIKVDIKRPRDTKLSTSEAFIKIKEEIMEVLES